MIGDVLQPTHLIFILVVALLVLGPKRLPEVGRSLGKGIRDFRGALSGLDDDLHSGTPAQSTLPAQGAPITPATTTMSAESPAPEPVTVAVAPTPRLVEGAVPTDSQSADAEGSVSEEQPLADDSATPAE